MKNLHNNILLILACYTISILCQYKTFQMQTSHPRTLQYQAHPNNHQLVPSTKHFRHSLSTKQTSKQYLSSKLHTDGTSFKIKLNIAGLDYKVHVDTGSSDLVIKGSDTKGSPQKKFNCLTYGCIKQDNRYYLGYLDGFMSTYATTLPVKFDQIQFKVPLLVADQASKKFNHVEGICGVSFPKLAVHQPTFIQTMINSGNINKYAYGLNCNFIIPNTSFIDFGTSNPNHYDGELDSYPITGISTIVTDFNYIKIGQSKKLYLQQAVLDSGNTCISIDRQYQQDIISAFQNKQTVNRCYFYTQKLTPSFRLFICRIINFDQLPQLQLVFKQKVYKISKEYYIQYCIKHADKNYCVLYIQSTIASDQVTLGDGFLNRFYTFFDLDNKAIGIAPNKQKITLNDVLAVEPKDKYRQSDWGPLNY